MLQEDLMIYNSRFNLSHQVDCAGTIQNIKNSFGHNKVIYRATIMKWIPFYKRDPVKE